MPKNNEKIEIFIAEDEMQESDAQNIRAMIESLDSIDDSTQKNEIKAQILSNLFEATDKSVADLNYASLNVTAQSAEVLLDEAVGQARRKGFLALVTKNENGETLLEDARVYGLGRNDIDRSIRSSLAREKQRIEDIESKGKTAI